MEEMEKARDEACEDIFFSFTMRAATVLIDHGLDSQTKVARIAKAYKEEILDEIADELKRRENE